MTPNKVEQFLMELRENWFHCGAGVLELCQMHQEELVQEARVAIQDLLGWLESLGPVIVSAGLTEAAVSQWIDRWLNRIRVVARNPLSEAFGATLGCGPGSTLLENFRWWGKEAGVPCGTGGPVSDLPPEVAAAVGKDKGKATGFAALWDATVARFPVSVNELQLHEAKSPWTAAYLLNWLLSDVGVLPSSKRTPVFVGPPAVPNARTWLDQMDSPFRDWRVLRFQSGPKDRPRLKRVGRDLIETTGVMVNPEMEDAYSQLVAPVLPAAYIVRPGDLPLDLRALYGGATQFLTAAEGQCCVFDLLISRLALLEAKADREARVVLLPRFKIIDGDRAGTFRLKVGDAPNSCKISKGAAELLYFLGRDGRMTGVLPKRVKDLKEALGKFKIYFSAGSKKGNYYHRVATNGLRGHVDWDATPPRPSL